MLYFEKQNINSSEDCPQKNKFWKQKGAFKHKKHLCLALFFYLKWISLKCKTLGKKKVGGEEDRCHLIDLFQHIGVILLSLFTDNHKALLYP